MNVHLFISMNSKIMEGNGALEVPVLFLIILHILYHHYFPEKYQFKKIIESLILPLDSCHHAIHVPVCKYLAATIANRGGNIRRKVEAVLY